MSDLFVTKSTGVKEVFSEEKLKNSIRRAGIPDATGEEVLKAVKGAVYPDVPTREIYGKIIGYLGPYSEFSGKYSLKQSIMELGPTGYPFEKFVAKVFSYQGYATETQKIMQGRCVSHEVDVVASRGSENFLMECKYHNLPGRRTDIKTALYVWARYEDIMEGASVLHHINRENTKMYLVTNTKCTTDAIAYANCRGMSVLSWGYPPKGNLQDMIEEYRLHPITCLTTLNRGDVQKLLMKDLVLCRDIFEHTEDLSRIHLSKSYDTLQEEVKKIIG